MKRYILTFFAALTAVVATAWPVEQEAAFKPGEKLSYLVSYKAAMWPNTILAEAKITTSLTSLDGVPAYHVWANGSIMKAYSWAFNLSDTYEVWLDTTTIAPVRFANDIREGNYRYKSQYFYDWDSMKVTTVSRNAKWTQDRHKEMDLRQGSMDAMSIFFNMRCNNISTLSDGQDSLLQVVFTERIEKINFKFLGRETKTIRKVGTFKTLKFACQLKNDDGDSLVDGSEFYIWVTDDRNRVPIYLESPIRIGSIQAFVMKMEGLKYPLDSKIR